MCDEAYYDSLTDLYGCRAGVGVLSVSKTSSGQPVQFLSQERTEYRTASRDLVRHSLFDDTVDIRLISRVPVAHVRPELPRDLARRPVRDPSCSGFRVDLYTRQSASTPSWKHVLWIGLGCLEIQRPHSAVGYGSVREDKTYVGTCPGRHQKRVCSVFGFEHTWAKDDEDARQLGSVVHRLQGPPVVEIEHAWRGIGRAH